MGGHAGPDEPSDMATAFDTRKRSTLVPSGRWVLDGERSTVGFEVRHLKIARVRGRFHAVMAEVSVDDDGVASLTATIRVASIDTGEDRRDARICAEDFFDVQRHPTMSFGGRAAPVSIGEPLTVSGTMTIRGVSRPLELVAEPPAPADRSASEVRLRGRSAVSRRDFGLEWDSAFAAGGLVIDDRVALCLDVVLVPLSAP